MAMIEAIDGAKLIEAFRAGRRDRLSDQEADIKRRKGESELATEQQYRGLAGQFIRSKGGEAGQLGIPPGGGVADQYSRGALVATPEQEAETTRLERKFPGNAATDQPLQNGETAPPMLNSSSPLPPRQRDQVDALSPNAPPAAPTGEPHSPVAYDPDILRRMTILKPQQGADIARAFKTMDEAEMKQRQVKSDAMGLAAHYLKKFPKDQRPAHMAYVADHLRAAGMTDEQIAGANLSDEGLDAYQALAVDYDHLHANELAERRLEMAQANVDADNARADRNTDSVISDRTARRGETRRYHDQSDTTRRRGQDRPRAGRATSGGRGPARPTATGPNGEKIEFDGKAWVPAR